MAVLEARVIGGGQTGRTTAHLMPWNDDYYALQVHDVTMHVLRSCHCCPPQERLCGLDQARKRGICTLLLVCGAIHTDLTLPMCSVQKLQLGDEKLKMLGESHMCAAAPQQKNIAPDESLRPALSRHCAVHLCKVCSVLRPGR